MVLHDNNLLEQFSEVVNKVAERFHQTKGLTFVRVDGTKNGVPGVVLDGFPSVFLYNQEKEKPATYDGDYTYDEIVAFLKKEAKYDF